MTRANKKKTVSDVLLKNGYSWDWAKNDKRLTSAYFLGASGSSGRLLGLYLIHRMEYAAEMMPTSAYGLTCKMP